MPKQLETILYVEDGATAAGIKNTCEQYNSIKEYAFILHDKDTDGDGNPIKSHFHLYCRFGNTNVSIKEFADWFNVTQNKVEKIKAKRNSQFHVLKYYLHRDYPEKYQYAVADILGNMDVPAILTNGISETRREEIIKDCAAGIITPKNFDQHVSPEEYTRNYKDMKNAWDYYEHQRREEYGYYRNMRTIFVTGHSGVGKTTTAMLFAKDNGLERLIAEMERRKLLLAGAGCENIDEYNAHADEPLQRIIFACDEVAELLDKTGRDKDGKALVDALVSALSKIARLGRAFGIHLFLATQRPDAGVLIGQIKNNIPFRICGVADSTLSMIILDCPDAASLIPKNAHGRFLLHDGTVFQAYWCSKDDMNRELEVSSI